MKVLIFGATGLLGKALMREWAGDPSVVGLGSQDADLRSPPEVEGKIAEQRPDAIVLAAAYTDVDGCETNQELAFAVNCSGAVNVAHAAKAAGIPLIFLSSDYVFDGNKRTPYETADLRGPRTVYGKTKAEAEERILDLLADACVLRTSWVFGIGGKCFPDTILQLAAAKPTLDVVNDQRGCPTYTVDLAHAIHLLTEKRARGIVHATNRGECSWFEFATEIVQEAGLPAIVSPTTSDKFVRPAERPKYSVLSSASLDPLGISMPTWKDAVRRYLAERKSRE
jgi:dTDP-4-dehydrorhamnose reductase